MYWFANGNVESSTQPQLSSGVQEHEKQTQLVFTSSIEKPLIEILDRLESGPIWPSIIQISITFFSSVFEGFVLHE